ncbi:unnamed protein product [Adineta steineri]|uniref:Uncharacterized protein n=1 Tax=Adineta steineri TaxID=433720 RepID=A0A815F604_9BILA|nr:unnamed protein product [Adineta steineri]
MEMASTIPSNSPTGLTDACYDKADSHFVTCAQNGNIYVFDRNLDLVKRIRCDGPCHCIAVHKRYLFVGTKTNELEVRSFPDENQIELQRKIHHSNLTDASRLAILKARDDYVQTLKEEGRKQLLILTQDRSKYKTILANLTAQGLFLLMEKDVTIRCRRNDHLHITIDEKNFLPDDSAGSVELYAMGGKIKVSNTTEARFSMIFNQILPEIREKLFGVNQNRKYHD